MNGNEAVKGKSIYAPYEVGHDKRWPNNQVKWRLTPRDSVISNWYIYDRKEHAVYKENALGRNRKVRHFGA